MHRSLFLLAVLVVCWFPALARAADLTVSWSCAQGAGAPDTDPTLRVFRGNTSRNYQCTINYSNNLPSAVDNVHLRVSYGTFVQSGIAPALPDGVDGRFNEQTWRWVQSVMPVSGSPTPEFDSAAQTVVLPIGSVPAATAAQAKFQFFSSTQYPSVDLPITLAVYLGPPGVGALAASEVWTAQVRPLETMQWWSASRPNSLGVPFVVDDARNAVGGLGVLSHGLAHTRARFELYLPYRRGSTYVADGAFNPADPTHQRLVDRDAVMAQLSVSRPTLSTDYLLSYEMPPGVLDWPLSGPNAHAVVKYAPDTASVVLHPGILGGADSFGFYFSEWRVRWSAPWVAAIPDDTLVPYQVCLYSAETIGHTGPGDPRWCYTESLRIGAESAHVRVRHLGCPNEAIYGRCTGEDATFPVGDAGQTEVQFGNRSSVTGLGSLVLQLPGSATRGGKLANFESVNVSFRYGGPEWGPSAASSMEIQVSTQPSDYADGNVGSRVVPSAAADFRTCKVAAASYQGVACTADDLIALGIAPADVHEVRVRVHDMRSDALTLLDQPAWWIARLDWTLPASVPSSIDGTYSATSTLATALGSRSVFTLDAGADGTLTQGHVATSEVSREALARAFTGLVSMSGAFWDSMLWSSDSGLATSVTMMQAATLVLGVENVGTLDNVRAPVRMCAPIPLGLRFEALTDVDPANPHMPRVHVGPRFVSVSDARVSTLPTSAYRVEWTPLVADTMFQGIYCVEVTSAVPIPPGAVLQAVAHVRVVPGARTSSPLGAYATPEGPRLPTFTAYLQSDAGDWAETTLPTPWIGYAWVSGRALVTVLDALRPGGAIAPEDEVCYDLELDTHAFASDTAPVLDAAGGATLPTLGAVSYHWVPRTGVASPAGLSSPNAGNTHFTRAGSPDALGVYVSTVANPSRVPTTPDPAFVLCIDGGDDDCSADDLVAQGIDPTAVRWVAIRWGNLEITDAEPRGVAPFDGEDRINDRYAYTVCVRDDGTSVDDARVRSFIETYATNLDKVSTEPEVVIVDESCADGAAAEVIGDGIDGDCDGFERCYDDDDDDGFLDASGDTRLSADLDCDDANEAPASAVTTDCHDFDATVRPGGVETPDGTDEDCDGIVDETTVWYDDDGDGFADVGDDCDDASDATSPVAVEVCNGVDDDCDGITDETTECYDDDGDGLAEDEGDCHDGEDTVSPDEAEVADNGIDDDCDGVIDAGVPDPDRDGYSALGGDCATTDGDVYPGAPELEDGKDNDCDGIIDEGTLGYDDDGDGSTEREGDCHDGDATIGPDAAESVDDGVDDDCDGTVDEGSVYTDDDGDGWSDEAGDCDDANPLRSPDAEEILNGIDDDCDGVVDADAEDLDGDGYTVAAGDCDDTSGWARPGLAEECDGVDNDCDGAVDEDCTETPVEPAEGCGCSSPGAVGPGWAVLLAALAGWRRRGARVAAVVALAGCGSESDLTAIPSEIAVSPGLIDLGTVAVGADQPFTVLLDHASGPRVTVEGAEFVGETDFFSLVTALPIALDAGDTGVPITGRYRPTAPGWHLTDLHLRADTDDDPVPVTVRAHAVAGMARVLPSVLDFGPVAVGASATRTVRVENTGVVDLIVTGASIDLAAFALAESAVVAVPVGAAVAIPVVFTAASADAALGTLHLEWASDVAGEPVALRANACDLGVPALYDLDADGYTACAGDCDDAAAGVHPGQVEAYDGVDEDCDGVIDEGTIGYDDDGDGLAEIGGDCNDGDSDVHPAAIEVTNFIDDDCDGIVDANAPDADGDGYAPAGGDCDDTDATIFPGAAEVFDGDDQDCDGPVDEGTIGYDDDGDGLTELAGDCDDTDTSVRSGATELPDGKDNDCDGSVDEGTARGDDDGDGFNEVGGDCDDADASRSPAAGNCA